MGFCNNYRIGEVRVIDAILARVQPTGASARPKQFPVKFHTKTAKYTCRRFAHFLLKYKRFCFLVFFYQLYGNFNGSKRRERGEKNFFYVCFYVACTLHSLAQCHYKCKESLQEKQNIL